MLRGDPVRVEPSGLRVARHRGGGVGELGAAAVVDAHGEREDVVVRRQLLGDLELLDHRPPEPRCAAGPAHLHAQLVHLVAAAPDHVAVEAHQELHLGGGAGPVLRRERVGRDRLDPDLDRALDHVEQAALALLVPDRARLAPRLRPAPVAVHDDRDVRRDQVLRDRRRAARPTGAGRADAPAGSSAYGGARGDSSGGWVGRDLAFAGLWGCAGARSPDNLANAWFRDGAPTPAQPHPQRAGACRGSLHMRGCGGAQARRDPDNLANARFPGASTPPTHDPHPHAGQVPNSSSVWLTSE